MKKTLLFLMAMFAVTTMFGAKYQLPLDNLGSGWESSYDNATHTITFDGEWKGRGWWFGESTSALDASAYTKIEVKFEAVAFQVQVVVEYDGFPEQADMTKAAAVAGETSVVANLDAAKKAAIKQIYIQSSAAGTLKLTDAYLTDGADEPEIVAGASFNFENDAIGTAYGVLGYDLEKVAATVEANPAVANEKSLHLVATNYRSYAKFPVTLPAEKTLANVEKITFDIYFQPAADETDNYPQNRYKALDCLFGESASFNIESPTLSISNLIADEQNNTWISKNIPLATLTDETLLALNSFDFAIGINHGKIDYFLDNIQFILKDYSAIPNINQNQNRLISVEGGISVNANAQVTVFGIDGRVIKQTVTSEGQVIPLQKGVYIVKAGNAKLTKMLVK